MVKADDGPDGQGEHDLATLLRTLDPRRRPGVVVFTTAPADGSLDIEPIVSVQEDEGRTLVLARGDADRLGLTYEFEAAMITLHVHSALAAVGLTAVVAGALAEAGISANVVAGLHHDHLFVPIGRADEAVTCLEALTRSADRSERSTMRSRTGR